MALTVPKARVAVLKALAHPTRLEIIQILSQGTRCVSEIEKSVGGDMSTVSKHLSLMRKAGLIGSKKGGLHITTRSHAAVWTASCAAWIPLPVTGY